MLDDDKLQAFFDVLVQWKEEMASPPEEQEEEEKEAEEDTV